MSSTGRHLIILDRDGVLNRMLVGRGGELFDSPMNAAEVEVFPYVPAALRQLNDLGFGLAIATNQPAWAKGKTSRADLLAAHERVVCEVQSAGAVILSSHICWHRAEDGCRCRKPKSGLLEAAFRANPTFALAGSWMVGDRVTDVIAGADLDLQTAFLGTATEADRAALAARGIRTSFSGGDLTDFVRFIVGARDATT